MADDTIEQFRMLATRDVEIFLGPRPGKKSMESLKALNPSRDNRDV